MSPLKSTLPWPISFKLYTIIRIWWYEGLYIFWCVWVMLFENYGCIIYSCLPILILRWELVLSHDVMKTDRMVWLNRFLAHQRLQTSQIVMLHDETKLCVRILIVYFIGKIKIKWRRSILSERQSSVSELVQIRCLLLVFILLSTHTKGKIQ